MSEPEESQTPITRSMIVTDENGEQTALPFVAVATFADGSLKALVDALAPVVAAMVVKAMKNP